MPSGAGDDTLHTPLPFFRLASDATGGNDTAIDLVFVLNKLQTTMAYTSADIISYTPILLNESAGCVCGGQVELE
ncbi:hypothetical protein EDB84DRAFT_1515908 [Lactarius hengduanensis]|nr:hypothetical protein EDB84DRAFT_1515908 [Lactarius hengduanensis]